MASSERSITLVGNCRPIIRSRFPAIPRAGRYWPRSSGSAAADKPPRLFLPPNRNLLRPRNRGAARGRERNRCRRRKTMTGLARPAMPSPEGEIRDLARDRRCPLAAAAQGARIALAGAAPGGQSGTDEAGGGAQAHRLGAVRERSPLSDPVQPGAGRAVFVGSGRTPGLGQRPLADRVRP